MQVACFQEELHDLQLLLNEDENFGSRKVFFLAGRCQDREAAKASQEEASCEDVKPFKEKTLFVSRFGRPKVKRLRGMLHNQAPWLHRLPAALRSSVFHGAPSGFLSLADVAFVKCVLLVDISRHTRS